MDLTFSESEATFRDELGAWFERNDPGAEAAGDDAPAWVHPNPPAADPAGGAAGYAWPRGWQRRLADDRYAAVHWPVEYGGRGATVHGTAIFFAGLGRARPPAAARAA